MIDSKLKRDIEAHTLEIINTVQNPNKHHLANKFTLIKIISSTIDGMDKMLSIYETYLPIVKKVPTPLYDAMKAEREELDLWRKAL